MTKRLVKPVRGLAEFRTHADGAVQGFSMHVAKECQLSEFEAECLLLKALGVHGIDPQDGLFEATKVY